MTTKTIRRISAVIAAMGFLFMLTEKAGGPWAGTFIGLAMFCAGVAILKRFKEV